MATKGPEYCQGCKRKCFFTQDGYFSHFEGQIPESRDAQAFRAFQGGKDTRVDSNCLKAGEKGGPCLVMEHGVDQ